MENLNQCDYGHAVKTQVRLMPYGGDGNIILCYRHYLQVLEERNEERARGIEVDTPAWETLKVYEGA